MVRHYVDAINTPGMVPNVQTAWENFVMTKCSEALKASCNLFKETMTAELSRKLPCDNDFIRTKHEMAFQKGLSLFEDETFGIAGTTTKTYLKEFMVGKNKFHFSRKNGNFVRFSYLEVSPSFFRGRSHRNPSNLFVRKTKRRLQGRKTEHFKAPAKQEL